MSPTQVYRCPSDGEFDIHLSFKDDVPQSKECPDCGQSSPHILKPPAGIRVVRGFNEQANEWQRDPYTQAKAQATNMYNEQRDAGIDVPKPTEQHIQQAAAEIAKTK